MAAKNPNPGATTKVLGSPTKADAPRISYDDAELAASRIRASWELVDDELRGAVAADLLEGASAPSGAQDTIIDGVPPVGMDAPPATTASSAPVTIDGMPALSEKRSRPVSRTYLGLGEPTHDEPRATRATATAKEKEKEKETPAEERAPASAKPGPTITDDASPDGPARGPEARAGKEAKEAKEAGVVAKKSDEAEPVSKRAVEGPPSSKGPKSKGPRSDGARAKPGPSKIEPAPESRPRVAKAPHEAVAHAHDDDISIPVTGASGATLAKIGLGLVAVIALGVIGYGALGGGKTTASTPTATATPVQTAAPAPTLAPAPPVPTGAPATTAPVVTSAPTTPTAAPAASAASSTGGTASAAPTVTPAATSVAKVDRPKSDPPKKATPPPTPQKKSGGIIRETPF